MKLSVIHTADRRKVFSTVLYRCRIRDIDYLIERLIEEWHHFDHGIIDRAAEATAKVYP